MRVLVIMTIQCLNMPGSSIRNRICLIINYYYENRLLSRQAPRGEYIPCLVSAPCYWIYFICCPQHSSLKYSTLKSTRFTQFYIKIPNISLYLLFLNCNMCINYTWSYIWCILIIFLSIKLSYSFLFSLNSFLFLISLFFTFVSSSFLFLVHQWI